MEILASLPTFNQDHAARTTYAWFELCIDDPEAQCFYKYPFVGVVGTPDLLFLSRRYQPLVVKCFDFEMADIFAVTEDAWKIRSGNSVSDFDAPSLIVDDLAIDLKSRFERARDLRRKISPVAIAALPRTDGSAFFLKFGFQPGNYVWAGGDDAKSALRKFEEPLSDQEWRLARSVLQTAFPLTKNPGGSIKKTSKLGAAIRMLDSNIALLDDQQTKAAIQIPPGPQRIRGLAGTGKTVLLAMKAANIHKQFPDCRILFTFHTQSLYNQARNLITKFYRFYSDVDPNWDNLHVRHGWGSKLRPGVYRDLSQRQGVYPLNYADAKAKDPEMAFRACCKSANEHKIEPYYDYILVDEAQDFPKEFFPLLYSLARDPKPIYWAYDELQSLASLEIPNPSELFGNDAGGTPLVSLDTTEDDGMERDLVLFKAYRCPLDVLMLAHALGLGIHNPRGCVQMLGDEPSWNAVGYEFEQGKPQRGEEVTIFRPLSNSPNLISEIYAGDKPLIEHHSFESREEELAWVANSVEQDINSELVAPENIVVISLDSMRARTYMSELQRKLVQSNIGSTIPGLVDDSSEFAEPGLVTLSTVFRAKGNEAPIVYILAFDYLYGFAEEIENRNRAFTAISRAKGWVRITGSGNRMRGVQREIQGILDDLPRFRFKFPDIDLIRKLDASETTRRRREVKKLRESVKAIMSSKEALADLSEADRRKLIDLLRGPTN